MQIRLATLWRHGPLDGGQYLAAGAFLLALKYLLDWLVAGAVFHRPWSVIHYLVLPGQAIRLLELPADDRIFYGTLLALALPFIGVGTALTLRRLRTVGLPAGLVVLFFVPLVNLFLFVTLSVLRSRDERRPVSGEGGSQERPAVRGSPVIDDRVRVGAEPPLSLAADDERVAERLRLIQAIHKKVVPERPGADAAFALAVSVPLALLFTLLAVERLDNYGWGLFVGMPFCLGMGSVLLYGLRGPRPLGYCLGVASLSILCLGCAFIVLAFEGAICLIMAAPLGLALALMGGVLGYAIQSRPWNRDDLPVVWLALALVLPALMAAEQAGGLEPEVIEVTSYIDIDAPPERVWSRVLAFPPLDEPDEWLFRAGVAYPVRAEILGQGPGAVRHCVFSTGTFVEPIDAWEPPRRLAFTVTEQPAPMVEWSPYDIHPPHLDHYLVSRRGEFRLLALPDGRTRLQGTTWYTNKMWPETYWRLWSDHIIHQIHLRVLRHIRQTAEGDIAPHAK